MIPVQPLSTTSRLAKSRDESPGGVPTRTRIAEGESLLVRTIKKQRNIVARKFDRLLGYKPLLGSKYSFTSGQYNNNKAQ